ncbi:MAG: TatD family hydrolase, partial [Deltaproteobacteria bacterium]|nr:TatD family hydrolase [Deltaproteobacteria bacterium]
MKLFDSHCHLDDRIYDKDIDDVIKRANEAGVSAMMIVGTNKDSSTRAVALAKSHSGL